MLGWLQAFEAMQLISIEHRRIKIHRRPSDREIVTARKNLSDAF
jgi:hypothetical protein